ncbi:hypothetical protein TNCV_3722341 [Trichonephila clavipes]|nr:hypothetical protein TNCV_3722341 [Trichonephila clavipes]
MERKTFLRSVSKSIGTLMLRGMKLGGIFLVGGHRMDQECVAKMTVSEVLRIDAGKELASVRCVSFLQEVPVRGSKVSVGVGRRESMARSVIV